MDLVLGRCSAHCRRSDQGARNYPPYEQRDSLCGYTCNGAVSIFRRRRAGGQRSRFGPLTCGYWTSANMPASLRMRRSAISAYSGLSSISTALRPSRSATSPVVPAPPKGSRHTPGTVPALQEQDGSHPIVWRFSVPLLPTLNDPRTPWSIILSPAKGRPFSSYALPPLTIARRPSAASASISRAHGAPQSAQTSLGHPARMHGLISAGGKVAK